MNMMVGCPIPGESQPKEPVRPVDANGILRSIDMDGSAYDGSEYQACKTRLCFGRRSTRCNERLTRSPG